MKPIFAFLLISILLLTQSCKKDSTDNYSSFLSSNQFMFSGKLSDSTVSWTYSPSGFQRGNSVITVGGTAKALEFWLTANYDYTTQFYLATPSYVIGTDDLFNHLVSLGEKEVGPQLDKFFIRLRLNTKFYTTTGDQTGSHFKVLKMEKGKDGLNNDMVSVWFTLNCKFYDDSGNYSFSVQDGKVLAEFLYNL